VRHAFLVELVGGKTDLPNAVALTSLIANAGRLVGPAIAGLVIAGYGEAACFVLNALSFVAVLVTFAMMRVTPSARAAAHAPVWRGLAEGFSYAWRSVPIRLLLALLAIVSLTATPYTTLMPVLVRDVYAAGANVMGFLVGAAGLGGVAGTLFLASRPNLRGLIGVIACASLAAGSALALLSWPGRVALAMGLMTIVGFGILVTSVSVNMILQTIVEDDKRGRVMSLYTAAFLGMSPIGAIAAGAAADVIGVAATLTIGGIATALAGLYVMRKRGTLSRALVMPPQAGIRKTV
jgi:predicted MFS family arabinose efflux permease